MHRRERARSDCFRILGLQPTASGEEVKQAYRRLALALHPDASGDAGTSEEFIRVTDAYETLSRATALPTTTKVGANSLTGGCGGLPRHRGWKPDVELWILASGVAVGLLVGLLVYPSTLRRSIEEYWGNVSRVDRGLMATSSITSIKSDDRAEVRWRGVGYALGLGTTASVLVLAAGYGSYRYGRRRRQRQVREAGN